MSFYKRPNNHYWWARIMQPNGGALRISTKTINRKAAEEWHAKTQHELWQQQRLGVKPQYFWEDAVVKWCEETTHKATHRFDVLRFR